MRAEFALAKCGRIWYPIGMGSAGMQQGMQQGMVATAAMQLFMRTLQATGMELSQLTAHALASNPALEELPPAPREESEPPTSPDAEATRRHAAFMDTLAERESLASYLEKQLLCNALPTEVEEAALTIIQSLNERGCFPTDTPPEQLAEQEGIRPSIFREALNAVQELDPPGVGARDLRESLLLQLSHTGEGDSLAAHLLRERWNELVEHRYEEIARELQVREEEVTHAARRIARLDPNPGSRFAEVEQLALVPDILVTREGDDFVVSLTGEMVPRLTLSSRYRDMMAEQADNPEIRQYLSRCFREGRAFMHAIAERQRTILRVAQAITRHQRQFFLRGPQALVPLRMDALAAELGVHVSTISRAVRGKYLRCSYGVFELRSFFSAALPSSHADGEAVSAQAIQSRLRALIAAEDTASPLSDADLQSLLAEEGFPIARRTIAKYREQLKILPARQRRL